MTKKPIRLNQISN